MKKAILPFTFIVILFSTILIQAQTWTRNLPQDKLANNLPLTFYEIQEAFNTYWDPLKVEGGYYIEDGVKKKASGWKQFKRWEWFWESRVDPVTGEFPNISAAEIRQQIRKTSGARNADGNWQSMGPNTTPGGYAGLGRLNCIAFVDGDIDRFYVGSPSGGLWKTTDGGTSWEVKTDDNDVLGVSDAFVIPGSSSETDTVYIATGDRDGGSMWSLGGDQIHDNNTIGVLKSVDGGSTWSTTALTWIPGDKKTVNRLLKHPGMNDSVYATGTDGVFLSVDGGTTWPKISGTFEFIDMEFKPMDPGILYGSTKSGTIYKSGDKGITWSLKHTIPAGRIELAVSEDIPEWVYAIASETDGSLEGIHKSEDSGETWSKVFDGTPSGSNLLGYYCDGSGPTSAGQGSYDLCIAADPTDAGTVFIGGVNTWKSTDGGSSWTISNMWTSGATYNSCGSPNVHADQHALAFQSGTSTLFECNDGGLYKTTDGGTTWDHLGNGLVISQLYRLGVSQSSSNNVIAGLQDNGTKSLLSGTWTDVLGGDGMECIIDYTDDDTQYGELYFGDLYRTTDGWATSTSITAGLTGSAAWVTPIAIDPVTNTTIYIGLDEIWKSTDQGSTWTKISTITPGATFRSLAIAPSDPDNIYAATKTTFYVTDDGGSSWADLTGTLPVGSSNITYISVKSDDPGTVWVAMGEYNSDGVYESTDGGTTWSNISAGLPSIPVMCVIQDTSYDADLILYAATDVGVYVKVGSADWTLFSEGLPNVVITELEIYYNSTSPNLNRIRAATYGRGLWESELYSPAGLAPTSDFSADNTSPVVGETVTFNDLTIDDPDSWFWSFDPPTVTYLNGTSSTSQNPEVKFDVTGSYEVELYTENVNGSDTETKSGYITVTTGSPTYCTAGSTGGYGAITKVEFGSIDNSSGWTSGYSDYTSLSTNITIGVSQSLTVTNGYSDSDLDLGVWIDWNQDGDFDDIDEDVVCDIDGGGDGTFSIAIPSTAVLGSTRMRLRTKYWPPGCGSPCGSTLNGEVEDYTVNVLAGDVTWDGTTSADWAIPSNWSNSMVPTTSFNVTIPTSPTGAVFPVISESTLNAACAGLTIESGASLTINGNLSVDSTITNSAGTSGIVIGSSATKTGSLITSTDDVDATVNRYLDGGKWHLIAAPLKDETVESLYFSHDPEVWIKAFEEGSGTDGDWGPTITSLSTSMPLGKGFAVWLETGKTGTASFENSINTMDVSPTVSFTSTAHGYNLVGNPFTSAIDWDQGGWSRTGLEGSVWVYKSGSGYLTRNSNGIGSLTDGIIPVAQGFFVRTTSGSGSLTIPALSRVHSSQAYYKNSETENEDNLNPYLVFIVEEDDITDEVWITFCEDCTDAYDNGWDTRKFFGVNSEPQLYTVENDLNLSINALPPLNENERLIPLNFEAGKNGTHQLTLKDKLEMENTNILLEDLKNDVFHDFNNSPTYVFEAVKNHPAERFMIHLNPVVTNIADLPTEEQYTVYAYNKTIYIKFSGIDFPGKVQVVDLYGRTIYNDQLNNSSMNRIPVHLNYGYLIVKIIDDGEIVINKVFVQ